MSNKTTLAKFMEENKMAFSCVLDVNDSPHIYKLGIVFNTMNRETGHDDMTEEMAKNILIKLGELVNGN